MVGGGQAGLSMSWHLKQRGIDHTVFEKHTAMHAWRTQRWDSFCLVTPNWQCLLPGYPYAGPDPHGFMVECCHRLGRSASRSLPTTRLHDRAPD